MSESKKRVENRGKCGDCRFWWPIPLQPGQGQCRVDPPRIFPLPAGNGRINMASAWPSTSDDCGCGKHEDDNFVEIEQ